MLETIKKEWPAKLAIFFFLLLSSWWLLNNFFVDKTTLRYDTFFDFGEFYGYMALWGGIWGLIIAKKWGGFGSIMGKAMIMFSLGLFAQEFGQLFYAWYNDIFKVAGPYPSFGDLGYFGSIPLYILGIYYLAKASGVHVSLQSAASKIQVFLIPLVMLGLGYFLFLKDYTFDWSQPLKIFLDFGYPFGQAIYVAIAMLTYSLTRGILGGKMKSRILFFVFALFVQFLSDYTFLYQSSKGTWTVGGINDYMYLCSYFLMALALIQLKTVYDSLRTN